MARYWIAMLAQTQLEVVGTGQKASLMSDDPNGAVGFLPCFKSRRAAKKFVGNREAEIIEIEVTEPEEAKSRA